MKKVGKIRWHFILFWVALFLFWYCAPTEGRQADFDTRLIHKLSEMLKVEPPKKILVERLDQKDMLDNLRKMVMVECMSGKGEDWFRHCVEASRRSTKQTFIHGIWIEEKDPTYLHIKLYKRDGIDVVIHEYLHWYMHHSTEPKGFLNSHEIVMPMVAQIITSEELIKWLEKEGG